MSRIVALPDLLQQVASELSSAGMAVAGLHDPLRTVFAPAGVAAPTMTAVALEQFMVRWGVGLGTYGTEIQRLGRVVELAALAYLEADGALGP